MRRMDSTSPTSTNPSAATGGEARGRASDAGWVLASGVSALILLAGAGWWAWGAYADRTGGPAVGQKVELAPGVAGGGGARLGGLRDLFGGGNRANRPPAARGATQPADPPATRPAR